MARKDIIFLPAMSKERCVYIKKAKKRIIKAKVPDMVHPTMTYWMTKKSQWIGGQNTLLQWTP